MMHNKLLLLILIFTLQNYDLLIYVITVLVFFIHFDIITCGLGIFYIL